MFLVIGALAWSFHGGRFLAGRCLAARCACRSTGSARRCASRPEETEGCVRFVCTCV
jgi:hypothetical protein